MRTKLLTALWRAHPSIIERSVIQVRRRSRNAGYMKHETNSFVRMGLHVWSCYVRIWYTISYESCLHRVISSLAVSSPRASCDKSISLKSWRRRVARPPAFRSSGTTRGGVHLESLVCTLNQIGLLLTLATSHLALSSNIQYINV